MLTVNDFIDPARWNIHIAREAILADLHRIEKLLKQNLSGVKIG